MALMFAICSPQPNWIPKNPKLMFQICQKFRRGLLSTCRLGHNFGWVGKQIHAGAGSEITKPNA